MTRDDAFEIIIEPDVVPAGTLDVRSLDAPPGAVPPAVRVTASGQVLALGADSRQLPRPAEVPALTPAPAPPVAVPAGVPADFDEQHLLDAVVLDDEPDGKTLLAVDEAVKADLPPRPAAASGASPRVAAALHESDPHWDEVDTSDLEGGFSAVFSLAKVLVVMVVLSGGLLALGLHLLNMAPWQEPSLAAASPSPSQVDLAVPESPAPSETPAASPSATPVEEPAPSETPVEEPSPSETPAPTPEPTEVAAVIPAVALDALRVLAEDAVTGGEVGVEEDEPGLLGRVEGLRKQAVEAYRAGDYDAAEAALDELLALVPTDADAHLRLGVIHYRRGDYDQAKERYLAAAEYDPQDPRPLNNLSLVQLAQGARDDARATLERALALAPEDPDVLVNLGRLQAAPRQALPLYDKALSVAPRHASGRLSRAHVRAQLGDTQGARGDLEHLTEHGEAREAGQAYDALGLMAQRAGQLDQAVDLHRKALERDPASATARMNLGVALLDQGRPQEALPELEQAVASSPRSARAWLALGVARTRLADTEPQRLYDAKDAYEEAIKLDGENAQAHHNYALCAERFGNFLFAMREYERAIELDPESWSSYANLARLYFRGGQVEKSFAFIDQALERAPDSADLHYQRAWMLAQERRDAEARASLERFLEVAAEGDPRRAEARRGLGPQGS